MNIIKEKKIEIWKNKNLEFTLAVKSYNFAKIKELIKLCLPITDKKFILNSKDIWDDGEQDDIEDVFFQDVFFPIKKFLETTPTDKSKFLDLLRLLIDCPINTSESLFTIISKTYMIVETDKTKIENLLSKIIQHMHVESLESPEKNLKYINSSLLEYYYKAILCNENHDIYLSLSKKIKEILKINNISHKYLAIEYDDLCDFNQKSWLMEYELNKSLKLNDDNINNNLYFLELIEKYLNYCIDKDNVLSDEDMDFTNQSGFIVDVVFNDYNSLQNNQAKNINYMAIDLYWTIFSKKCNDLKVLESLKQQNTENGIKPREYDFKIRMIKRKLLDFNKKLMLFIEKVIENQDPTYVYNWLKYINVEERYYKQLSVYVDLIIELNEIQTDESGNGRRKV